MAARLRKRMAVLGIATFSDYYRFVTLHRGDEELELLDCISTKETRFFREPSQLDFLVREVFPRWQSQARSGLRERTVTVWSAACSTGEEPCTLAMLLLEHFPRQAGWEVRVLATDLSRTALRRAEEGIWSIERSKEIPDRYLERYMLKGTRTQQGKMKAGPEVRGVIRYRHLNLMDDTYSVDGKFDLIFCRNVLIYFDPSARCRVVSRLLGRLSETGCLCVGHAESLNEMRDHLQPIFPSVYMAVSGTQAIGA